MKLHSCFFLFVLYIVLISPRLITVNVQVRATVIGYDPNSDKHKLKFSGRAHPDIRGKDVWVEILSEKITK